MGNQMGKSMNETTVKSVTTDVPVEDLSVQRKDKK